MWHQLWGFRPVFSGNRAQANQQEYERKKKTRARMRIGAVLLLVGVGYLLHRWLSANNASVSEQATVYLTLVLVFVTYLSWDVMVEQNLEIARQLDQMEFQQRAWLATSALKIEEPLPNAYENQDSVDISEWGIEVRNTGTTPAIITHSKIEPMLKPIGEGCKTNLAELEGRVRDLPRRRTVVAPGFSIEFRLNDDGGSIMWSEATVQQVRADGGYYALLIGAFIYEDVFGIEHKSLCAYRYSRAIKQLANNYQDGEMT